MSGEIRSNSQQDSFKVLIYFPFDAGFSASDFFGISAHT